MEQKEELEKKNSKEIFPHKEWQHDITKDDEANNTLTTDSSLHHDKGATNNKDEPLLLDDNKEEQTTFNDPFFNLGIDDIKFT